MDNLNKLGLLCVVMALFVAGCGKKKTSSTEESKKYASADIPVLKEETENLLEDDAIENFAFVDDETLDMKAPKSSVTALNDDTIEIDTDSEPLPDDNDSDYAFKTVKFDFNKNSIRTDQKNVLTEDVLVAQQAVEQGKQVVIEGHSCQIGSATYNLALSQRRAEAVKAQMLTAGIAPEQIKTIGYGYERPLVWSDEKNRSQLIKELAPNRRAEVLVN